MAICIRHSAQLNDAIYNVELPDGTKHPLVKLGRHSYGHEFFVHWEGEACQIEIGRYSSIAHGVRFFAGQEHHTEWEQPIRSRICQQSGLSFERLLGIQ